MGDGREVERWGWRDEWWVVLALVPVGFTAWIAPIYAGVRARRTLWVILGLLWAVVWWSGGFYEPIAGADEDNVTGGLLILGWLGALATTLAIRPAYRRAMTDPHHRAVGAARERLERRRELRRLAAEEPELAKELGTRGSGLMDVNNASVGAIEELPGVNRALAERIVRLREEVGGFASVEELGAVAELDGALVERIRDEVLFLPR